MKLTERFNKHLGGRWYQKDGFTWYDRDSLRVIRGSKNCRCDGECNHPLKLVMTGPNGKATLALPVDHDQVQRAAYRITQIIRKHMIIGGDKVNGRNLIREIERNFKL